MSVHKTKYIKSDSYDNLLTEVNHLMVPKQTFSCFVVDRVKYSGVELPYTYTIICIYKEVQNVYGLEAINAHNGWAMAVTGAVIVAIGLSVLSFIISQLHRITDIVDSRNAQKLKKLNVQSPADVSASQPVLPPLSNLGETMNHFKLLTQEIGDPFDLAALFQIFIHHDDPHPHLTIRSLREQGYLVSAGEGLFSWKHQ